MYYDKERDYFANKSAERLKNQAANDVRLSLKFVKTIKYAKLILAIFLALAYFYKPEFIVEILVVGMVLSLVLPLGFSDTYLEKLIELRAAETDERQTSNATEANKHFATIFEKIEKVEPSKKT